MPLTERDTIRIRQFIQRLESGLILGQQAYVTYHDSNLAATPSNPTGDGTTGGWHRLATEASNWMSVKVALSDSAGTWGTPIRVFGLQGTETAGVGLSADIPKLAQITFIGDGSSKVGWTAGTVEYGGNSYAISVKAVGNGSTNAYIYWDAADGQTSFKTTASFATAIAANHYVQCYNISGKAIPAVSYRILHGGLILAATIVAAHLVINGIDGSGDLDLGHIGAGDLDNIPDGATYAKMLEAWKKPGDTTKIDGGKVSAATILAAAISTYALTAGNATIANLFVKTAHIENLNVTTGKIDDSATSIYEVANTAGSDALTINVWKKTQDDSITSLGGVIQISMGCTATFSGGSGSATVDFELRKGAVVLDTAQLALIAGGTITARINMVYTDIPGSGSHTYDLYVRSNNNNTATSLRVVILDENRGK